MPTYELRCEACGHRFEVFVMRMLREADAVCPACGSTRVAKGVGGGFLAADVCGTSASSGPSCGTYG